MKIKVLSSRGERGVPEVITKACSQIILQTCKKPSAVKRYRAMDKLYFWPIYSAGLSHILVMSGNYSAITRSSSITAVMIGF